MEASIIRKTMTKERVQFIRLLRRCTSRLKTREDRETSCYAYHVPITFDYQQSLLLRKQARLSVRSQIMNTFEESELGTVDFLHAKARIANRSSFLPGQREEFSDALKHAAENGVSEDQVRSERTLFPERDSPNLTINSPLQSIQATSIPLPPSSNVPNHALLWHIPSSVDHPLRSLVGPSAFHLLTAPPIKTQTSGLVSRKATKNDAEVHVYPAKLLKLNVVDVDSNRTSGTSVSKPGGMAGIASQDSGTMYLDAVEDQVRC